MADPHPSGTAREPLFNAPLLTLVLPAIILGGYGLQVLAGPAAQQALVDSFALNPLLLRQGHWDLLLSYMFVHGGWFHAGSNAVYCLIFSTPVIRAMGRGAAGVLSFLMFYLICGIVAGLGYCLLNWRADAPALGASGAVFGLVGAASRLLNVQRPKLNALFSSTVVTMTLFFCVVASGVLSSLFPSGLFSAGVPAGTNLAWQAHIAGFLFGLLLIEPWLRLFHRQYFTTN